MAPDLDGVSVAAVVDVLAEELVGLDAVGVGADPRHEADLGCNSIDIWNFGHETGRETGSSSGTTSVLGP